MEIDKDKLKEQINQLNDNLKQQHEILDSMLETCGKFKQGFAERTKNYGLYIAFSSAPFMLIAVFGLAIENLTISWIAWVTGAVLYCIGLMLLLRRCSK